MANKETLLPNALHDVEKFKLAIKDRRAGKSLSKISEAHYGNGTAFQATLRKARELVDDPKGAKEDRELAKAMVAKWDEASRAAGKVPGGGRKPLAAAAAKSMLEALKDC